MADHRALFFEKCKLWFAQRHQLTSVITLYCSTVQGWQFFICQLNTFSSYSSHAFVSNGQIQQKLSTDNTGVTNSCDCDECVWGRHQLITLIKSGREASLSQFEHDLLSDKCTFLYHTFRWTRDLSHFCFSGLKVIHSIRFTSNEAHGFQGTRATA